MFQTTTKTIFTSSTKKITSSFASKSGVFTSAYTPFITTNSLGISYTESSIISGGLGVATLPLPSIVLQATSPIVKPPPSTNVSSCEDYLELADLAETINHYLMLFSSGNMSGLAKSIDINVYITLSLALSHVKKIDDTSFKTLYKSIEYSLTGLYQSILQYNSYTEIKHSYEVSMEKSKILDNLDLLRAYLESLRGVRSLFGTFNITTVLAKIKPQYARYIELYGFPESGVFDPIRLAECVEFAVANPEYGISTN